MAGATPKLFNLIVIDPPWEVSKIRRRVRPNQIEMDYPTMDVGEIVSLPIKSMSMGNCWLFLWSIQKYLPSSYDILSYWGFRYLLTMTWDKGNGMCLSGFHYRTEFVVVGCRGSHEVYRCGKAIPTTFSARSYRHSEKPDIFYAMVGPLGDSRIDIFARKKREGWYVWGNEVESDIDMEDYI